MTQNDATYDDPELIAQMTHGQRMYDHADEGTYVTLDALDSATEASL